MQPGFLLRDRSSSSSSTSTSKMQKTADKERSAVSLDRFKYIPVRLDEEERQILSVLESALEVSEYTDNVDVIHSHLRQTRLNRIISNLVEVLSITTGLMVAANLTKGEALCKGKSLSENVPFFKDMFEIGRRYKIMNPTKMRDTYGKLMWILMDTEAPAVKRELNIDFVKPLLTVYSFLEERESLNLLLSPSLDTATATLDANLSQKSREELIADGKAKTEAIQAICQEFASEKLTKEDIARVLESIADNNSYLSYNVKPVERMIALLKEHFDRNKEDSNFSLELTTKPKKRSSYDSGYFSSFTNYVYGGYSSTFNGSGASLSHSHSTQYSFVLQSLTLWCEIMRYMPRLWALAEADMLNEGYRLCDTGQGYNRLHTCPSVGGMMRRILNTVQKKVGDAWVGLSVVHLGDRDVPNALVFIDKYTQVPRILSPVAKCIDALPSLKDDAYFHSYVKQEWGSVEALRLQILSDFFKHGFDGSGDDGGSCIDGRLTSAWNWCSKLEKKPYYNVFMFTGFQGFDGDWKN